MHPSLTNMAWWLDSKQRLGPFFSFSFNSHSSLISLKYVVGSSILVLLLQFTFTIFWAKCSEIRSRTPSRKDLWFRSLTHGKKWSVFALPVTLEQQRFSRKPQYISAASPHRGSLHNAMEFRLGDFLRSPRSLTPGIERGGRKGWKIGMVFKAP